MARQALDKYPLLAQIHAGDILTFTWCMQRKRQRLLTKVSRILSCSADGFFYPLIPLGLYAVAHPQAEQLLLALVIGFAVERPLYQVLKRGFRRNRPAQALADFESVITPSDQFSFPSGHTSGAFMVATVVAGLFPALIWPLYLWASLVGASRIFLGVHFPTDSVAGAVMGASLGVLALAIA